MVKWLDKKELSREVLFYGNNLIPCKWYWTEETVYMHRWVLLFGRETSWHLLDSFVKHSNIQIKAALRGRASGSWKIIPFLSDRNKNILLSMCISNTKYEEEMIWKTVSIFSLPVTHSRLTWYFESFKYWLKFCEMCWLDEISG